MVTLDQHRRTKQPCRLCHFDDCACNEQTCQCILEPPVQWYTSTPIGKLNVFMKATFMLKSFKTSLATLAVVCATALYAPASHSAQGEMGIGIPEFGSYSAATGASIRVWSLGGNSTVSFPQGCTSLLLTPGTMGMDAYKIAAATLLAAKVSGKRVRFFAHAPRDDGCGVDYVQLLD
jgi:hypothetical protein